MKTTIPKLRRIIRNVIKESAESAVGIDDYEKLFKARRAQRSAPSGPKGYGWGEFIAMAEDGDYDGAGEWIQGLASDYGITLPRDVEDSFIEMASADTDAAECQRAWNEYLEMVK